MNRRSLIRSLASLGLMSTATHFLKPLFGQSLIHRSIPSSGEKIPVVGMGSWLTFDVGSNERLRVNMRNVLQAFFSMGGRVIDSSPMYGSSERVIGELAKELGIEKELWISTKVWTNGLQSGQRQIRASNNNFHGQVHLHHVHNMRDFETHYKTLTDLKARGQLRYVGVTHYTNSAHTRLIDLMKRYPLDFVQINYNINNPAAADRLIPEAVDRGIATIINRPFQGGSLFGKLNQQDLPPWSKELEIENWASYFLKYIIGHKGVTCAIPATTKVRHAVENLQAGTGYLPNEKERRQMLDYYRQVR